MAKTLDKPADIVVATCTMGQVTMEWAFGYRMQSFPMNMSVSLYNAKGYNVADARSMCVEFARQKNAKWLVFYDDDIIPHSKEAIMTLFYTMLGDDNIDILSGVYPAKFEAAPPIVWKDKWGGVDMGWKDGKVHEVYLGGTGLCIIRMSSLMALNVPMRRVGDLLLSDYFGSLERTDDVHLAEFVREQGQKLFVHGGVTADQIRLDGRIYELRCFSEGKTK